MTRLSIKLRWVAACLVSVIGISGNAHAQSTLKCRPADDHSANLISELQRYVKATDARTVSQRDNMMHLPVVATKDVSLVRDEKICTKIVQAYTTLPNPYTPTRLYVVKMGSKGYVGYDPDRRSGEFSAIFVFNTKYVRTGGWIGG